MDERAEMGWTGVTENPLAPMKGGGITTELSRYGNLMAALHQAVTGLAEKLETGLAPEGPETAQEQSPIHPVRSVIATEIGSLNDRLDHNIGMLVRLSSRIDL